MWVFSEDRGCVLWRRDLKRRELRRESGGLEKGGIERWSGEHWACQTVMKIAVPFCAAHPRDVQGHCPLKMFAKSIQLLQVSSGSILSARCFELPSPVSSPPDPMARTVRRWDTVSFRRGRYEPQLFHA
jgi:hypothetical protein